MVLPSFELGYYFFMLEIEFSLLRNSAYLSTVIFCKYFRLSILKICLQFLIIGSSLRAIIFNCINRKSRKNNDI